MNTPAAPADKKSDKAPKKMLVLDTTALPGQPPRVHEQIVEGIVKPFTFEAGKPLPLPPAIAIKFLQHDSFWLVNEKGERLPYSRRPKQPEELGAREKFKLADHETIARYDELSTKALFQRVLELPGGEKLAHGETPPERAVLISFILDTMAERRKANTSSDRDERGYTPKAAADADFEEEEVAA